MINKENLKKVLDFLEFTHPFVNESDVQPLSVNDKKQAVRIVGRLFFIIFVGRCLK